MEEKAMAFKVSFFWTCQQDLLSGWSENWWNNLPDINKVVDVVDAMRTALDAVHGNQSVCPNVRISDATNFRNVKVYRYNVSVQAASGIGSDSDYATNAALLQVNALPNVKVKQWIKGIKDADISNGGRWTPTPATTAALNKVNAIVTSASNGWCVNTLSQANLKKTVTNITNAGVVTCKANGYDGSLPVRISRAQGVLGVNGLWGITIIDANTFSLNGYTADPDSVPFFGKTCTAQLQARAYTAISGIQVVRATEHRVGRPFGLATGRRKRKKV
jgi:hypothetical protein